MPKASPRREKTSKDEFLRSATSNYNYSDSTIKLTIDDKTFCVSKNRLSMRSAVFQGLFSLPQGNDAEKDAPLPLHNVDASEFQDYLWYIHADPLCAKNFFDEIPSVAKISRLLGIANVCHQYDAMDVALWALKEALAIFGLHYGGRFRVTVDIAVARRLLNVISRWQDPAHAQHVSKCRDVVCDALHPDGDGALARDPILLVEVARQDPFVLAHVYYYVLRKEDVSDYDWKRDARLSPADRRRLLCGSHALGRMRAKAAKAPPVPPPPPLTEEQDLLATLSRAFSAGRALTQMPRIDSEIKDKRKELWAMFDDSPWTLL